MEKKTKKIIIICELILMVSLAIFLMVFHDGKDVKKEKPKSKQLDYTELAETEYIELPAVETLKFKADTKKQKVEFHNPETNNCDFVITIKLSDDSVIYKSDKIKAGETVTDIVLTHKLIRGIYGNCSMIYNCYDSKDGHEQNGGVFRITIYSN